MLYFIFDDHALVKLFYTVEVLAFDEVFEDVGEGELAACGGLG